MKKEANDFWVFGLGLYARMRIRGRFSAVGYWQVPGSKEAMASFFDGVKYRDDFKTRFEQEAWEEGAIAARARQKDHQKLASYPYPLKVAFVHGHRWETNAMSRGTAPLETGTTG